MKHYLIGYGEFAFLACLLLAGQTGFAQIVPSDRLAAWNRDTTGIPGGIPYRTTIYTTLNPGGNVQTAISGCPVGQVVKLNAGTYDVSGLTIQKSITLRGSGPNSTFLRHNGGNGVTISSAVYTGNYIKVNAASGYTKGSSNIVLSASNSSLHPGFCVIVAEANSSLVTWPGNGGATRSDLSSFADSNCGHLHNQTVIVTALNGTSMTFWPPLTYDFYSSNSPAIYFYASSSATNNFVNWAGLEDLCVTNTANSASICVYLNRANYCWVSNVNTRMAWDYHIKLERAFRCEFRHNDLRFNRVYDNGTGYCVGMEYWSCANLFEDNIIANTRQFVQVDCGGTGNAVIYNYMTNAAAVPATPSYTVKSGGHHNAHPMMNLWEGNIGYKMVGDFTWGSSSHNTWLRNWMKALMPYSQQVPCALEIGQSHHHFNVIGNIFGYPGITSHSGFSSFSSLRISPQSMSYQGQYATFRVGYYNDNDSGGGADGNANWKTCIVGGNYDYVAGAQTWYNPTTATTIPDSYFYSSKPAYFGSLAWPPIDPSSPSTSITETNIPAGYRWRYGVDPLAGSVGSQPPAPPQNLRVVGL